MQRRPLLVPLAFYLLLCFVVGAETSPLSAQGTGCPSQNPICTNPQEFLSRAERGDAGAQMWLGTAYEQGWFGTADYSSALKWLQKSAEHGSADAQAELGAIYAQGEGVKQNYSLAARWYRKAAEHFPNLGGAGQGRNELGLLYLDGRGVRKDYVRSYMWFKVSHADNPNLPVVRSLMTSAQVAKAEQLAKDWNARHPQQ